MQRSTSWKISSRRISSFRRVFQGDFQVLVHGQKHLLAPANISHTSLSSLRGSMVESISSGTSTERRKCSLRELYAERESLSVERHDARFRFWNSKNDYGQSQRGKYHMCIDSVYLPT